MRQTQDQTPPANNAPAKKLGRLWLAALPALAMVYLGFETASIWPVVVFLATLVTTVLIARAFKKPIVHDGSALRPVGIAEPKLVPEPQSTPTSPSGSLDPGAAGLEQAPLATVTALALATGAAARARAAYASQIKLPVTIGRIQPDLQLVCREEQIELSLATLIAAAFETSKQHGDTRVRVDCQSLEGGKICFSIKAQGLGQLFAANFDKADALAAASALRRSQDLHKVGSIGAAHGGRLALQAQDDTLTLELRSDGLAP